MAVIFQRTGMLTDAEFHYCPGCTHGVIHRLVAEVIEEMGTAGAGSGRWRPSAARSSAYR